MAQLGITIEANKTTYQENIAQQFGAHDDYDIFVGSWGSDFPDPSGNLRPNFGSENIVAGGANASAYSNPDVDALLQEQNTLTDKAERAKLLIEAQAHHRRGLAPHLGHQPRLAARREQAGPGCRGRPAVVLGIALQERLGHRVAI